VAVDILLRVGTTLYALVDGEVVWAGASGNCGYGVAIRAPGQHASVTYCHLSAIHVSAGQHVAAGEPVGRSGGQPGTRGAGNSTGPHLHLHIDTPSGRRCPQALLLGLWRGWPVPTIAGLRTSGCTYTYTGIAPPPQSPVPIPPDLPVAPEDRPQITSPDTAADLLAPLLQHLDPEQAVTLNLDAKHRLIATTTVSIGSVDHTFMSPREVFRDALLQGAGAIVIAHNHPSGDAEPSRDDERITRRLGQAGEIVGIEVLDHIVIGHQR
jgi:DNA repair protein RadC